MYKRKIPDSELIINEDGSIFHLHLHPGQLADTVILVGDQDRVDVVASYFDQIEHTVNNREFRTVTGYYKNKRLSVVSTGIGTDNIDIVMNELDALVNIDFKKRTLNDEFVQLKLLRMGTCGAIQSDIKIGDFVLSKISVGFDGLLNFYAGRNGVSERKIEMSFMEHANWSPLLAKPYFVKCSPMLADLFADSTIPGMTISTPGFYAPQGRRLRLEPANPMQNKRIESFRWEGMRFLNFEMEGSGLAGLSRLLGHEAATICTVIAQRVAHNMKTDYRENVNKMIVMSLDKLSQI